MKTYPSSVLALFDKGQVNSRDMIRLDLGSGSYGFIRSMAPLTYAGVTYVPGGIIKVSDISASMGRTEQGFTLTLSASPDFGLTPEVLKTIEEEDYRDRRVVLYEASYHPDTNELLHVQPVQRGYIDTIDHVEEGDYSLVVNCASRGLDYSRSNQRRRTGPDQERRAPGDKWFEHCGKRGREVIAWGKSKTVDLPNITIARPGFIPGVTNV